MTLLFATHNKHKAAEIAAVLPNHFAVKTLADVGYADDIPEPFDTLPENAQTKAVTLHQKFSLPVFAEDTGLVVPALNGEPGVRSARYAGEHRSDADNMALLLQNLQGKDRSAAFVPIICFIDAQGQTHVFEGRCPGHIAMAPAGSNGFGYDPIFIPDGEDLSFAQMDSTQKNRISHRRKAVDKLVVFLKESI